MKPLQRIAKIHSLFLNSNYELNFGEKNTIAQIHGQVQKLSKNYSEALVVLFNKVDMKAIAFRKPDIDGNYAFLGLNTSLKVFIVAFDQQQQYNAVIQDNVVPK